ncbi:prepilin peptidase [Pseudonocardia sp. GCM10023141]|uniref:prepilin peptidase n=1 Tax=Pseudonocardia sp. GCM10023141 TaxID=3252653 RepID=UPI00361E0EC4
MTTISTAASVATGFVAMLSGGLLGPNIVKLARCNLLTRQPLSFRTVAAAACAPGLVAVIVVGHDGADGIILIPLVLIGGAATVVDVHERRLPDALTIPLVWLTAVVVTVAAILGHDGAAALRSLLTAAGITSVALVVKLVQTAAVGWGDIKLLPTVGAVLGWWDATALGVILWALLIGAAALLRNRRPADGYNGSAGGPVVPYGPALLAGTLVAVALAG